MTRYEHWYQPLKLDGGNLNLDGQITASGNISSSGKITMKEFLLQPVANNVTPFNIRNVDGEKQLDLSIDSNQHSELGIFKDGGEKIRFNTYWPAIIDNDFYETNGALILGSDAFKDCFIAVRTIFFNLFMLIFFLSEFEVLMNEISSTPISTAFSTNHSNL